MDVYSPKTDEVGSVEKFFLTGQFRSMTCPQVVQNVRTMPGAMDGFVAKLETLMGQSISKDWVANYKPDTVLDLSKTPKFDEINITYLVFRNDFVGSLLRRLLEHHAQKGTFIRILVADVIELDKDRASFQLLSSKYPNLKVHEYKWKSNNFLSISGFFQFSSS
jgi:cardiolipin synthase